MERELWEKRTFLKGNGREDHKTVSPVVVCLPICIGGNTVGVLQLFHKVHKKGTPFDSEDMELLQLFKSQAEVALHNAYLYDYVYHTHKYLTTVLDSITNVVLTFDDKGQVVSGNVSAKQKLGNMFESMASTAFDTARNLNNTFYTYVENACKGKHVTVEDDALTLTDGKTLDVKYSISPLLIDGKDNRGAVCVMDDLTQNKKMKVTLGRYLTPALAEKVLEDGGERLGGVRQMISIIFSDIRSFTTLTEMYDASQIVDLVNDHFTGMVDVIAAHDGILDKYIGDCLMATFGVPFPTPTDAGRSCDAALGMRKILFDANKKRALAGTPELKIGIGINTGEAISGNIGSPKRLEYTVIGDAVNVASRVESLTKEYGVDILITDATLAATGDQFLARPVDLVRVKGRSQATRILHLVGRRTAAHPLMVAVHEGSTEAFELYCKQKWQECADKCNEVLSRIKELRPTADSSLAKLYEDEDVPLCKLKSRCENALRCDVPFVEAWSGVWRDIEDTLPE
eukprot:GFYU01005914.1.p1 GENE.GFYU01005914.1~~GFYU01005914.1.p1  ORF type:complete len:544 (-),score=138.49 GFYU01005914.1:30-1571(-)